MFIVLFSVGCTASFKEKVEKGPISWEEVKGKKGVPKSSYETPAQQKVHEYGVESFQVKGKQVNYYYRNPENKEQTLQYWMDRWKNDIYHFMRMERDKKAHSPEILYYVNYDNNERFLYNSSSHEVIRVMYKLDLEKDEKDEEQK